MTRVAAYALILALCGCGFHHVTFATPPPTLTPQERVHHFMAHRPVKRGSVTRNGELISTTLIMANNVEVVAPEDLEPLVGPDTETMRLARESVRARDRAATLGWITFGAAIAGIVLTGFMTARDAPLGTPGAVAGWSMLIGGAVLGYPVRRYYTSKEMRLRREAFAAFPADLGARLNLCAHNHQVIPCEAPLEPPLAPPLPPATTVPARTALRMRWLD